MVTNVRGGGRVGALVWQQELGGDGVDAQVTGGVPPPGGAMDHMDDGETRGRQRVGITLGSGGNGSHGAPPHRGVHQEATGDNSGKGGLPPHL